MTPVDVRSTLPPNGQRIDRPLFGSMLRLLVDVEFRQLQREVEESVAAEVLHRVRCEVDVVVEQPVMHFLAVVMKELKVNRRMFGDDALPDASGDQR